MLRAWTLRTFAPLFALASLTVTALVIAAQVGLAFCNRRIDVPMPDMAGMSMEPAAAATGRMVMTHGIMICPIVLVLIGASVALAAVAVVIIARDPDRTLSLRLTLRSLSRLPLKRTASILSAFAICALAAILAVDGNGPPPIEICAALLAIVFAGASMATAISFYVARAVIALGTRLYLAIAAYVVRYRQQGDSVLAEPARLPVVKARLISRGRGLRAPPLFVR